MLGWPHCDWSFFSHTVFPQPSKPRHARATHCQVQLARAPHGSPNAAQTSPEQQSAVNTVMVGYARSPKYSWHHPKLKACHSNGNCHVGACRDHPASATPAQSSLSLLPLLFTSSRNLTVFRMGKRGTGASPEGSSTLRGPSPMPAHFASLCVLESVLLDYYKENQAGYM